MFINVSVWSSQLITDTVRAAQWGQFNEGSWLDGEIQPERRRVCKTALSFKPLCLLDACVQPVCVSIGICRDICLPSNPEDRKPRL